MNLIQKIREWLKARKERKKLIVELVERRDEVIKRALAAANRQFPEWLQDYDFPTLVEWIITPHITQNYEPFRNILNEERRAVINKGYRVLKAMTEQESSELEDDKIGDDKIGDDKKNNLSI